MLLFVSISCAFAAALSVAVFVTNPKRLTNQAFAFTTLLCSVWLACVYMALRAESALHAEAAIGWLLANNAIAAFFPWGNWLLKEAVLGEQPNAAITLRRSWPWFLVGVLLLCLVFTPSFIRPPLPSSTDHERGSAYFIYLFVELAAHLGMLGQAVAELRRLSGIRKIEMQFLIANLGTSFSTGIILNGIGSYCHDATIKQLSLPLVFYSSAVMGWAITVHRIFDARQIFWSLAHRGATAVIATILVTASAQMLSSQMGPTLALGACVNSGILVTLWWDKKSRAWLRLDGTHALESLRSQVIAISITEARASDLIIQFEAILREESKASFVTLLSSSSDIPTRFEFKRDEPAYSRLSNIGWATPESLQRRRSEAGNPELEQYLQKHNIGLFVSVPRGSPTPSLIVALGTKINHGPFTFPEVERIINVAELMDNILARSRLTTQAALQAKTEHLAMMSRGLAHDLKNLITPISSFLVHRERHIAPGTAEAEVHEAAQRSVRVITDYVGEALFFSNRLTPRVESVDLPTVFAAVQDVTRSRATTRGVSLVTRCEPPVRLVADAVLVQRMLANLVNNAIDASPAGSEVVLSAKSADRERVQFTVEDHGSGIGAENLKRIFDPYFTTKEFGDEVRGFGLGLTICQKIVALHHGTIAVESRVGAGTCVTIDLPANPPVTTESVSTRNG